MKKLKLSLLIVFLTVGFKSIIAQDSLSASPNPFTDTSTVYFQVAQANTVSLAIYNRWGNVVASYLKDTFLSAGSYKVIVGDTLPMGGYILILKIGSSTKGISIVKQGPTSGIINKVMLSNEIVAFPNPTNGLMSIKLNYKLEKNSVINIYNNVGKQVFTGILTDSNADINLSSLDDGIYNISIPGLNYNYKLIIIK